MVFTCAVPGCEDKRSSRHRFPNFLKDAERFRRWIELVGNEKLKTVDPCRLFNNYRVCDEHFAKEDRASNMYLIRTALPSRSIPHNMAIERHRRSEDMDEACSSNTPDATVQLAEEIPVASSITDSTDIAILKTNTKDIGDEQNATPITGISIMYLCHKRMDLHHNLLAYGLL